MLVLLIISITKSIVFRLDYVTKVQFNERDDVGASRSIENEIKVDTPCCYLGYHSVCL